MTLDLKKLIISKIPLSDSHIKCLMRQILEGAKYLHSHYVIHRAFFLIISQKSKDVTPGNMLISQDGILKYSDFGLARIICTPSSIMTQNVCTRWYRAPEVLFGATLYGPSIDMWSIGCIFAELLLRAPIFNGGSDIDQLTKIFTLRGVPDEEKWPGVTLLSGFKEFSKQDAIPLEEIIPGRSLDTLELLDWLLQLDPNKRCTAEQALGHRYFNTFPLESKPNEIPLPKDIL